MGQEKSGSPTEKRLTERLRKDPINDTSFSDYFVTSHTILCSNGVKSFLKIHSYILLLSKLMTKLNLSAVFHRRYLS